NGGRDVKPAKYPGTFCYNNHYFSTETDCGMAAAPERAHVMAAYAAEPLEASPEAVMPAAVSPEVTAEAAEPHETGTSVLALCTVGAPNNPHPASVLMPGLEPATDAVYELSPCPVPVKFGLSAPPSRPRRLPTNSLL
ncbi:hypothetical protein M9458_025782, partial [Cirrhinus mrigala]